MNKRIEKVKALCDSLPDNIVCDICYGIYMQARGRMRYNKGVSKCDM